MCAAAAQPRLALTPMIPTPNVGSGTVAPGVTSWVPPSWLAELEAENLVDEDHGDAPRADLPVDDQDLVHRGVNAVSGLGAGVFEGKGVLLDATKGVIQVSHDLLRADHQDH